MGLYNPFGKETKEIASDDLAVLMSISEGFYVEYKSAFPSKGDGIGKSVAAFANTYGGWIFYGVEEDPIRKRFCGKFTGIDGIARGDAELKIRSAVSSSLSSSPYFEVNVINGPCDVIGLAEHRCIIVVRVFAGNETPYIHSSGRVFRRVGDSSEPIQESQRHLLDELWSKGQKHKAKFRGWLERKPVSLQTEASPTLKISCFLDPFEDKDSNMSISMTAFRNIMLGSDGPAMLKFDDVYSSQNGFIARHVVTNGLMSDVLTWRYHHIGQNEITIPLSYCRDATAIRVKSFFEAHTFIERYSEVLRRRSVRKVSVVDVTILHSMFLMVSLYARKLMRARGDKAQMRVKIQIANVFGYLPYIDTKFFVESCEQGVVPVLFDDVIFAPLGFDEEDCPVLVAENEIDNDLGAEEFADWAMTAVLTSLGFDTRVDGSSSPELVRQGNLICPLRLHSVRYWHWEEASWMPQRRWRGSA